LKVTTRALYIVLLDLHPPRFRRRFALEMLYIFDQAAPSAGAAALLADAFVSLLRQWLRPAASWKFAAAVAGALLQITAGGLMWMAGGSRGQFTSSPQHGAAMEQLMQIIAAATGGIVLMVVAASLWMAAFARRRNSRWRSFR
jgi:hypothetical protein